MWRAKFSGRADAPHLAPHVGVIPGLIRSLGLRIAAFDVGLGLVGMGVVMRMK